VLDSRIISTRSSSSRHQRRAVLLRRGLWSGALVLMLMLFATALPDSAPADPREVVLPVAGLH
jgi:hypothetical protein